MWITGLFRLADRFVEICHGQSILKLDEEKHSFSRHEDLYLRILKLSDWEQLSYMQKIERLGWIQTFFIALLIVVALLIFPSFELPWEWSYTWSLY
jgi:hypothetical protein